MSLICTVVVGLMVFVAAIEPPDLLVWINLFAFGGLEAAFLCPIVIGLYWDKANSTGAISSIVIGVGTFIVLTIMKPAMGGVHAIVPTTLASLTAFVLGSYVGHSKTRNDRTPA